jgi:hypothetical protein
MKQCDDEDKFDSYLFRPSFGGPNDVQLKSIGILFQKLQDRALKHPI